MSETAFNRYLLLKVTQVAIVVLNREGLKFQEYRLINWGTQKTTKPKQSNIV